MKIKILSLFVTLLNLILLVALTFCNKNIIAQTPNPFGIMLNAVVVGTVYTTLNNTQKNHLIKDSLKVPFTRVQQKMQGWNSINPLPADYTSFYNNNLKVLLTISYATTASTAPAVPFPSQLHNYGDTLRLMLNNYQSKKPEVVVIENEETNGAYHNGPMKSYINMLDTAIPIIHARGMTVANGGVNHIPLCMLTWYSLKYDSLNDAKADTFAKHALSAYYYANYIANSLTPTHTPTVQVQAQMARLDTLLTAYTTRNLDYVNFHWYADSRASGTPTFNPQIDTANYDPKVLKQVIAYLKKRTGKTVITNEIGYLFHSTNYVPQMLKVALDMAMPYFIWYSGEIGEGSIAIHNSNASLRPGGRAYKCFIDSVYYGGSGNCIGLMTNIAESDTKNKLVQLSPNPTNGLITFNLSDFNEPLNELNIYNLLGEKVYSSTIDNSQKELSVDLNYLPNGIYTSILIGKNNKLLNKVVKN